MTSLKFKSLVLAASLVAASLSTSANASGSITATSEGFTFQGFSNSSSFDDYLAFTIGSSDIIGSLSGTVAKVLGNQITFTQFDIVNAAHTVLIDGSTFGSGGKISFGSLDGSVPGSSYFLHIAGTNVGNATYNGTLSITSAVPEPETYGMMLAGLGLMGFVARRRKSV